MTHHKSWDKFIKDNENLEKMSNFVNENDDICPVKDKVFRFFDCDLFKTKCVILGMDPYYSTYEKEGVSYPVATGRAFEVENIENFTDKYKQSSLSNIFKALSYYKFNKLYSMDELRTEKIKQKIEFLNIHKWYDEMEKRGVIFLNASLTTIIGRPGAHTKIWNDFMNELISYIDKLKSPMWLIWGKEALSRIEGLINKKRIIYSCHPASRFNNNFVEDCCFKKVKEVIWF